MASQLRFSPADLRLPLVQAPMAAGPSTPALAAAAGNAGALGFLAAGYLTPDALSEQMGQVRKLAQPGVAFGVNVFVPQPVAQPEAVADHRRRLAAEAERHGVELPEADLEDTDYWQEKLELLLSDPVPVVSFTFGVPDAGIVSALQDKGTYTVGTVTSVAEARQAVAAGVDALCVQGPEAGAHRGVFDPAAAPPDVPLLELMAAISLYAELPLIAAGGIATAEDVAAVRRAGADAAQLGTAFLRADEAGTQPLHRDALINPQFTETVVTRAFSGRWARALRNRFTDEYADAPAAYSALNQLTKPLRAAAAERGDLGSMSLYAGVKHHLAMAAPASVIVEALAEGD